MVAKLMRQEGVQVWSLTDHDTTSGWEEAQRAADEGVGVRSRRGDYL